MSHEIVACPTCGSKAFSLLRGDTGNIFGVTCRECNHSFDLDVGGDDGADDEMDDAQKIAEHIVETHTAIDDRLEEIESRLDTVERDIDIIDGGGY